jgi:carbon storage regulator
MLVLSRQLDESIMIGDDIVITLVDIRGDKIRLGIAAPPNVPIHRQEVYESIQRENMQAAFAERQLGESAVAVKPAPVRLRVVRSESVG